MPVAIEDIPLPGEGPLDPTKERDPTGNVRRYPIPIAEIPLPGTSVTQAEAEGGMFNDSQLGLRKGATTGARHVIDAANNMGDSNNPDPLAGLYREGANSVQMRNGINIPQAEGDPGFTLNTDSLPESAPDGSARDARAFDEVFGGAENNPTRSLDRASDRLRAHATDLGTRQSKEFRQGSEELSQAIAKADEGLPRFWAGVKGIATRPGLWAPMLAEVGGQFGVQAVGGRIAGPSGSLIAGGLQTGGATADEVFADVLKMDEAFFKASERFVELADLGMTETEARERLAYELSNAARWDTAAVSLFINGIPGLDRVEKILGGGKLGDKAGWLKSGLKSGASEAGSETLENEAANLIGNAQKRKLDDSIAWNEGWGDSGVDAVLGAGSGFGLDVGNSAITSALSSDTSPEAVRKKADAELRRRGENAPDPDADLNSELDDLARDEDEKAERARKKEAGEEVPPDIDDAENRQGSFYFDMDPQQDIDFARDYNTNPVADVGNLNSRAPKPIGPDEVAAPEQGEIDFENDPQQTIDFDRDYNAEPSPDVPNLGPQPTLKPEEPEQGSIDFERSPQQEIDYDRDYSVKPSPDVPNLGPTPKGIEPEQGAIDFNAPAQQGIDFDRDYNADPSPDVPNLGPQPKLSPEQAGINFDANPQQGIDFDRDYGTDPSPDVPNLGPQPKLSPEQGAIDFDTPPQQGIDFDRDYNIDPAPDVPNIGLPASKLKEYSLQERLDYYRTLRNQDSFAFDDAGESSAFIDELSRLAGTGPSTPNSATAESQATTGQSPGNTQNESTQQQQNNDGNPTGGNGQKAGQGVNPNVGQSQDNTASSSGGKAQSEERNNEADISETVAEREGRVSKPKKRNRRPDARQRRQVKAYIDAAGEKSGGRIQGYETFEDAPLSEEIKSELRELQSEDRVAPAFFNPQDGNIYIFQSLVKSQKDARGLVAHEIVHAGLMEFFGSEKSLRAGLLTMFKNHPDAQEVLDRIAHESGFDVAMYDKAYSGQSGEGMKQSLFIEEALAHMRENDVKAPALYALFERIRKLLMELGVGITPRKGEQTEDALRRLARDAERAFHSARDREVAAREASTGMPKAKWNRLRYSLRPAEEQAEWYSSLHNAALNLKQKKGTPEQMLAAIKKHEGIKAEELEWTGLENFLQLKEGSITKDEIADYLYENGVNLQVIVNTAEGDSESIKNETTDDDYETSVLDWSEQADDSSENWEHRVEDYMYEYDRGEWESFVLDMDDAIHEHIAENRQEFIEKVNDEISEDTAKTAFMLIIDQAKRGGEDMVDRQRDMFGEAYDKAFADSGLLEHWTDIDEVHAFARAMAKGDVTTAVMQTPFDVMDMFKDDLRDTYEEAAERQAEQEYMDNPRMEYHDSEHGYHFSGNDDYGYQLYSPYGDHLGEFMDEYDAKEAAEQNYRENNETTSENGGTRHASYLEDGEYSWYSEVRLTLPDLEGSFVQETHFDDNNVVAFLRTTDREITIGTAKEDGSTDLEFRNPYFIEEIQSDWHYRGAKHGYVTNDIQQRKVRLMKVLESIRLRERQIAKAYAAMSNDPSKIDWTALEHIGDAAEHFMSRQAFETKMENAASGRFRLTNPDIEKISDLLKVVGVYKNKARFKESMEKVRALKKSLEDKRSPYYSMVDDAPYKNLAWMELAAKQAIMDAINKGYETVAWPNSDIVFERWGSHEEFRKKFVLIYDTKMPSIMKKLAGNKPQRTEDGQWFVELNPVKTENVRTKGMPKFALRPATRSLQNQTTQTRMTFQRSGAKRYWDDFKASIAETYETVGRVEDWVRESGGRVDIETSVYSAMKRVSGRLMPRLKDVETQFVKPLAEYMRNNDIVSDELAIYTYAKHAPERNKHMRKELKLTPTDNPSGMSEKEAANIIAHFRSEGKLQQLETAARVVYNMREEMLSRAVDSGLIHEFTETEYNNRYQYYVPLKGFAVTFDGNGNEVKPAKARTGQFENGVNISGKEFRRALGRETKAFDPVSTMIADLGQMTVRSEYNVAGNHLLRFAQANRHMKDQWEIWTDANPKTTFTAVKRKDPVTGLDVWKREPRKMTPMEMRQGMFTTKYRGKQFYIDIKDARFKHIMLNAKPDQVPRILAPLRLVNRWLANVYTAWSLPFAVSNFIRDVPTAYLKILAEQSRDDGQIKGEDIANQMVLSIPAAFGAMNRTLRDKPYDPNNQMDVSARLMQQEGGMVGYYTTKSPEQTQQDMKKLLTDYTTPYGFGASKKGLDVVVENIELANRVVENSIRLTAFHHARMNGVSLKQAADLARELTVDFNARGNQTNTLSSLFLFFNPAVQGSRNFKRVMWGLNNDGSPRWRNLNAGQKTMIAAAAGTVLWSHFMRMVMGEDDDGEDRWDKRPDYHQERTFSIPNFMTDDPDDYFSLPVAYGYNVMFAIGQGVERVLAKGAEGVAPAMSLITTSMIGAFSPVGLEKSESLAGTIAKTMSPEAVKPFIELYSNENYFGSQIYNEALPFGLEYSDSSQSRLSTGQGYKDLALWLNKSTGGTDLLPGEGILNMDVHPETLKYWVKFLTGGPGTLLIDQIGSNSSDAMSGVPFNFEQTPVFGSFYSSIKHYEDINQFYNRANDIGVAMEDRRDGRASGDDAKVAKIDARFGNFQRLVPLATSTQKRMAHARKQRNAIILNDALDPAVKHERIKTIEDEIGLLADMFNREYNEVMRNR